MSAVLVAHRGEPETLPENSLEGFRAVLAAGATWLETDVHITADGVAILSHDPDLQRMTGQALDVAGTRWDVIRSLPAGQPERFGEQYNELRIATLQAFVELLQEWPNAHAFVEIKQTCLDAFGTDTTVDRVLDILTPVLSRCVLISFSAAAIQAAGNRIATGWVLSEWSDAAQQQAQQLAPEYLFVNHKRLPAAADALWPGPWQWAVYTVNQPELASRLLEQGIALVETNAWRTMAPRLLPVKQQHG